MDSSQAPESIFRRAVPHISGNWAGHVFVNLASNSWPIQPAMETFRQSLQTAGYSGPMIVQQLPFHLSLSRTFYLQISFVDSFVQALCERLKNQTSFSIRVIPDNRILCNDDQSRSFLVWSIQPTRALLPLVREIDTVLQQYQQPIYYQTPHFHVSLASFAGDVSHLELEPLNNESSSFVVQIDQIQCTFGTTKSYTIPLSS